MDYTLESYDSVTGLVSLVANYSGQAVCATTYSYITPPGTLQTDPSWSAQVEQIVANVLACVPTTAPNPNYDASLSACWV